MHQSGPEVSQMYEERLICDQLNTLKGVVKIQDKCRESFISNQLGASAKAAPIDPEPAENAGTARRQIAILLHTAGDEANEVFFSWRPLTGNQRKS